jgi:glyoxylase-like metal-dependent hydrolase (beta-lactamase superfamily II)
MPTNVHTTGHTATSVSFAWTNGDPYSGIALTNDGVHLLNEGINATTYTQSGMTAGQYSCFSMAAYNSSGVSGYTTYVCGQAA